MPGPQYSQAVANLFLSLFGQPTIPHRQRESIDKMMGMASGGAPAGGSAPGSTPGGSPGGQALRRMGGGVDPRMAEYIQSVGAYDPGRALQMAEQVAFQAMQPVETPERIQQYEYARSIGMSHPQAMRFSVGGSMNEFNTPLEIGGMSPEEQSNYYGHRRAATDTGTKTPDRVSNLLDMAE